MKLYVKVLLIALVGLALISEFKYSYSRGDKSVLERFWRQLPQVVAAATAIAITAVYISTTNGQKGPTGPNGPIKVSMQ